jgi:hypothetical protein
MDIYKTILELKEEKRRLDRAIAALEQGGSGRNRQPRRRSWSSQARRDAAERMRKYWEQRKGQTQAYSVNPPSTDTV